MNKPYRVYRCDDTMEGIFSAVYEAGISGYGHEYIRIEPYIQGYMFDSILFAEYIDVASDNKKSDCVMDTVRSRISYKAYDYIMKAVMSSEPERGTLIYRFVTYGFSIGAEITEAMQIPCVADIFGLVRNVSNELHRFIEMIRFQELKNNETDILFAVMEPKHYILSGIMNHFADRFNSECFIVYDKSHGSAGIYTPENLWSVYELDDEQKSRFDKMADSRDEYTELWKIFFDTIAIEERKNYKLQRSLAPLHMRKHMVEFYPTDTSS